MATAYGAYPDNGMPNDAEFTDATEEREERLHDTLVAHRFEKRIELLVELGGGAGQFHSGYHRRG